MSRDTLMTKWHHRPAWCAHPFAAFGYLAGTIAALILISQDPSNTADFNTVSTSFNPHHSPAVFEIVELIRSK